MAAAQLASLGMGPRLVNGHARQNLSANDLRRNRAGSARRPATLLTRARPRTAQPCRASSVGVAEMEAQVHISTGNGSNGGGDQRSGPPAAAVTFRAQRKLKYGQVLKLVGSAPQMGGWDCGKAPAMKWGEGDRWMLTLELPPGRHEYKVAVVKGHDPSFVLTWDEGPNMTLEVSEAGAAARSTFLIDCDSGSGGSGGSAGVSSRSSGNGSGAAAARGPADAVHAGEARPRPQPVPSLEQLLEEEERQLDEMMVLLQQERAARVAAETEVKALRRQVSTGATEASALIANSAALREEFASVAAQLEEAQAAREQLQAERDALAAQLQEAEAAKQALAAEREGLDGRLSWSEQRLATLQADHDRMAEEHAAAVARSAQLQAERESAPSELSAAVARCDSLAAERDSLALQLADARRQLDEAQAEAVRAQQEAERAVQQRAVLRSVGLLLSSFD
ncbi:hypothetical protein ABPG75_003041 [Micractinium tetrahymenae]